MTVAADTLPPEEGARLDGETLERVAALAVRLLAVQSAIVAVEDAGVTRTATAGASPPAAPAFEATIDLTTRDHHTVGSLTVSGDEPRVLHPTEWATLRQLAALVVDRLDLRLPGMELATRHRPLDGGNDAYDVFRLGRNDWGLFVVDACGRGPEADATTAAARAAVRAGAAESFLPSRALGAVNQALLADEAAFCSAVFARLELDKCGAWVTLASAGHPRPVVVRRAGWIDTRGHVGIPLGLFPDADVRDDRVGLGPGDALVVFTNGIIEARDASGDLFGDEALSEVLLAGTGQTADELADRVLDAARAFAAPQPLRDDAAVFIARVPVEPDEDPLIRVVRATGIPADELDLPGYPLGDVQPDLWSRPPEPPREARMRLGADAASLRALRDLLRRLLRSWRLPESVDDDVELLATELAANVIDHAPDEEMTVIVRYLGPVVRVEVGDGSPELPKLRRAAPYDLDGRGLALVEALSAAWGAVPTRSGKRVWFEVALQA